MPMPRRCPCHADAYATLMPRACSDPSLGQIKESMQEIGRNNSKGKQAIAGWAKRHALAAAQTRQLGGDGTLCSDRARALLAAALALLKSPLPMTRHLCR